VHHEETMEVATFKVKSGTLSLFERSPSTSAEPPAVY
jgi:hypothetical protein